MELRHLRYFVAVAESLNFTKAAASLHLAQPSLTRQIHNLEAEIGVRLLNRSKSQVALTEEGRAFLVDARRVLALAAESVQAVQRLSRGETGQLNIAYSSNFNFELLPETLGDFRQAFPHIALNLFDMTPAEQFRALEARKIDLGFGAASSGIHEGPAMGKHRPAQNSRGPAGKTSFGPEAPRKSQRVENDVFCGHVREDASGFSRLALRNLPAGGLYAENSTRRRVGTRAHDLRRRRFGRHAGARAHQKVAPPRSGIPAISAAGQGGLLHCLEPG